MLLFLAKIALFLEGTSFTFVITVPLDVRKKSDHWKAVFE